MNEGDLLVTALSLGFATTALRQQPGCAGTVVGKVLPQALALVKSPLLQGARPGGRARVPGALSSRPRPIAGSPARALQASTGFLPRHSPPRSRPTSPRRPRLALPTCVAAPQAPRWTRCSASSRRWWPAGRRGRGRRRCWTSCARRARVRACLWGCRGVLGALSCRMRADWVAARTRRRGTGGWHKEQDRSLLMRHASPGAHTCQAQRRRPPRRSTRRRSATPCSARQRASRTSTPRCSACWACCRCVRAGGRAAGPVRMWMLGRRQGRGSGLRARRALPQPP